MSKLMKNMLTKAGVAVGGAVVAASSFAADPVDYSALTGAVSPTDITVGVLAIAGTLAIVYVTIKGAKTILSMIRSG